ncbi:hypothetical protein ACIQF6_19910 [Kitasatospora sp. NPDC092948]|uniref:hypothetical protein n=1 Tax=Kitasatospora sp. NPDC092948 TaxID=3364088 RepID=UPI00382AC333
MFKAVDPFTYTLTGPLHWNRTEGEGENKKTTEVPVGLFTATYQVTYNDDVQLRNGVVPAGVANPGERKYVLSLTQRITIYNEKGLLLNPEKDVTEYSNYPVLLSMQLASKLPDGMALQLLGYSPHTVNTKVQTSGTVGDQAGSTKESSNSHTVGSSTAQTNSYSASAGLTGDSLSFSVSAETSTTTTTEQSRTATSQSGTSQSHEASASTSMSVENWGAYALVNPANSCPTWTFGQEYPWDVIEYRRTNNNTNPKNKDQVQLVLPTAMTVRLYDGVSLCPPSHLSMFGINFSSHAQWIVTVDNSVTDPLKLSHTLQYFTASHTLDDKKQVAVYLDSTSTTLLPGRDGGLSTDLDLGVLGLDPVGRAEAPAVIGFVPSKFTVPPAPASGGSPPKPFSIFAGANTLLVRDTTDYRSSCTSGSGFKADETALKVDLTDQCSSVTFTLLFKVVDTADYALHLKHWKTTRTGLKLTIVVNGDKSTQLTKYVDASEAEGGENNLLSIALRNQNYASVDYSDLLTMGLNSVAVTVTPIEGKSAGYALRAISVEPS